MSLPERKKRLPHAAAALALLLAAALVAGCQVRPLYSDGPTAADGSSTGTTAELAAIAVKPVKTRYAQEVRNRLIFLLGGGSGQSSATRYSLDLIVTELRESSASIQVASEDEPTAGTLVMIATYMLKDAQTGETVSSGKRQFSASYDIPRQEFAAERAVRDAENRAARELAESLKLSLAQDLSRR